MNRSARSVCRTSCACRARWLRPSQSVTRSTPWPSFSNRFTTTCEGNIPNGSRPGGESPMCEFYEARLRRLLETCAPIGPGRSCPQHSTLNYQLSTSLLSVGSRRRACNASPARTVTRSPTRRGELGPRFRPGDAYRGRVTRSKGKRSTSAFRLRAFSRCLRTRIWLRT